MKRILLVSITILCFSCCGVKESTEENLKTISDLRARIVMIHHNDSLIVVAYKDSLKECQADKEQLFKWYWDAGK